MPKFIGRFNTLVIPIFTWLVLLIPFAVYQRYYVNTQQAYLNEHGFRLLSAVGRQLDSYLDSINLTVKAADRDTSEFKTKLSQKNGETEKRDLYLDYLRTFHPELSPDTHSLGDTQVCHDPKKLSVEFGPQSAPYRQCFDAPVFGRLSLDSFIPERLAGIGEDYFDDVLIANTNGDVLFQRLQDNRISKLDYLVSGGAAAGTSNSQADTKSAPPTLPLSSFQAVANSGSVRAVKLGGEDYNLFLQPFQLTSAGADATDGGKIILCGLWRTERLSSESFALPYSYVVWFGLICVAVGSFLWPFLKINYMSKAERLRRSQGWLLVLSMFLGVSSVTLMVLNKAYSTDVQTKVDADLRTLATQIQSNVDSELKSALGQLDTLRMTNWVQDGKKKNGFLTKTQVLNPRDYKTEFIYPFKYPFFDIAFWTDQDGNQLVKYTVDRYSTPRTRVNDRPFFQDIVAGQMGRLAELDKQKYSFEALFSPNTGLFSTVVATPFEISSTNYGTQALVFRPLSLVDPVLPADFGFAVLENDGKVLFHSNSLRNISENFIQECKDPSALQAAIFSNLDQKMDLLYSGKDRRVLVTRIRQLGPEPKTLIVFYNTEVTQTVNMAIILIGSVLMAFFTGILLIVAACDLLRDTRYPPVLIWPQREYSFRYILVVAINSLLVGGFLLLYSELWELTLLLITAVDLVLSIAFTALILTVKRLPNLFHKGTGLLEKGARLLEPHFRITYVAAAVSLIVAVTIIPCFGFFKFSRDAASELAAKHGLLKVLNDVVLRGNHVRRAYGDLNRPEVMTGNDPNSLKDIADNRIMSSLAHYEKIPLTLLSFEDQVEEKQPEAGPFQIQFDHWLEETARLFPASQLGGEMRMLQFETPDSKSSPKSPPEPDAPSLIHPSWDELNHNTFTVAWDRQRIYSQFKEWPGIRGRGWASLTMLWLFVGLWFSLLMKKIFQPDRHAPVPLKEVNWKTIDDIAGNFLLLGNARSGRTARLNSIRGIQYSDFRIEQDKDPKTFSPQDVVVLDHFDFDMGNEPVNQARLQVLERLVYKDRCRVVLVSSVDPVYYFADRDSVNYSDNLKTHSEFLDRWTGVMSSFHMVVLQDPDKSAFNELLRHYRNDPKQIQLIQWIEEECSHTSFLRDTGAAMLREHLHDTQFDRRELLNDLKERTGSYYSIIWSGLSASEHLVLYQLANDGWANVKNDQAIRQLQRKGLIHCAPMIRVMNESFRLFVRGVQNLRQIAEWEMQGGQSSWRSLKIGLLATAVGLGAWLFYAQKDLFQGFIGYILSLGAAITAIANILGGLKGRASSAPKSTDTNGST